MQRDARHEAVLQMLLDREEEDREAREKRQLKYRQYLEHGSDLGRIAANSYCPIRLDMFRTKVPCRVTPEARALLDRIRQEFYGSTISFQQSNGRQRAVLLNTGNNSEPKQIGWIEHCVETDPELCNLRHQGLSVETDGGGLLVLRFRYPATAVRMSARHNAEASAPPPLPVAVGDPNGEVALLDFTEIRPALDMRLSDEGSAPPLVWVTRPEVETMSALGSRDFEAFYMRFKLEVQAGIWSSLSGVLSSYPGSQWHRGSYYTVVRESDVTNGRIYQKTMDDSGSAVDIGLDRVYDASAATDILLLFLGEDILGHFADIYFTLQSLSAADGCVLKEEFFSELRRYWAAAQSLAASYDDEPAAVVRMAQRVVPSPAQEPLLRHDWTSLRQCLIDRYGEGGRNAAQRVAEESDRPRSAPGEWPFGSFAVGDVNLGLRIVYRQEWRHLGAQRGEVIRTVPPAPSVHERDSGVITETTIEHRDAPRNLGELVAEAAKATVKTMKWPFEVEGSINTGVRGLSARSDLGLEYRESCRDRSTRLSDIMRRMASKVREDASVLPVPEADDDVKSPADEDSGDQNAATYVYSRLQNWYEVLTRPAEIQNVVMVAEKLPTPAEIDLSWVKQHDWILANVLLDESFRDALSSFSEEESLQCEVELEAKRERLYDHIRAHILHYQRALWQQEDPQQRSMRYRKSGKKVPLEWRFELESGGGLTIDELSDRLNAAHVDGQFAAYSAGREADLDEVIDPAGPIGYYGNYAIYHMRPEFGSEELFSMLHFFKSPYLRANPETGEAEVADPVQIGISEDPTVLAASDADINAQRDEMFVHVPELRLELARARKNVRAGTDPGAVARLTFESGALRRHFATYLFRRQRTRRITLDTNNRVVDVIRRAEPALDMRLSGDAKIEFGDGREGSPLIPGSALIVELHCGHSSEAAQIIVPGDATPLLIIPDSPANQIRAAVIAEDWTHTALPSRAAPPLDSGAQRLVVHHDKEPTSRLAGGGSARDARNPCVLTARDEGLSLTSIDHARVPAIVPRVEERTPTLLTRAGDIRLPEHDTRALLLSGNEPVMLTSSGRAPTNEAVIIGPRAGARVPSLIAADGVATDKRWIFTTGAHRLQAGAIIATACARVSVPRADEVRRSSLLSSTGTRKPQPETERGPARDVRLGPFDVETALTLERVILARNVKGLRPNLVAR